MKLSPIALTMPLLLSLSAGAALAQTPTTGNDAPAAAPAPAASPSASAPPADTSEKKTAKKKKSGGTRMTREQELNHSIDTGTVPSRYRSQVPKEYQQYIPFDQK